MSINNRVDKYVVTQWITRRHWEWMSYIFSQQCREISKHNSEQKKSSRRKCILSDCIYRKYKNSRNLSMLLEIQEGSDLWKSSNQDRAWRELLECFLKCIPLSMWWLWVYVASENSLHTKYMCDFLCVNVLHLKR